MDGELTDHHSDLLFSAEVEVCKEPVLVYLLFEGVRGPDVDEADQQRIEACADLEQLDHWLQLAVTVATVEEIFEG